MKRLMLLMLILCAFRCGAEVMDAAGVALPIMDTPLGPKAAAMGEAFSAVADDNSAIYWNPAGMLQQNYPTLGLGYNKWFMDAYFNDLSLVVPAGPVALGAQLVYVDSGTFEQRDEFGNLVQGLIHPRKFGGSLAGAYGIGRLSFGAALKGYRETIADYDISGYAADLGFLFAVEDARASMVVRNIGGVKGFSLPSSFRVGGAFVWRFEGNRVTFSLDTKLGSGVNSMLNAGVELGLGQRVFLRAGHRLGFDKSYLGNIERVSGGVGFRYRHLLFDYAVVPYGQLGLTHKASLAVAFENGEGRRGIRAGRQPSAERAVAASASGGGVEGEMVLGRISLILERARQHEARGEHRQAVNDYLLVLRLDAGTVSAWRRLARMYKSFGMTKDAKICTKSALRIDPEHEETRRLWQELTAGQ